MNDYSYSHKRHVAEDAISGFVAGLRGVLEAKRVASETKNEQYKWIAEQVYQQRLTDLQERRLAISEGTEQRAQKEFEARQKEQERLRQIEEKQRAEREQLETDFDEDVARYNEMLSVYSQTTDPEEKAQLRRRIDFLGDKLTQDAKYLNKPFTAHTTFTERQTAMEEEERIAKEEADALAAEEKLKTYLKKRAETYYKNGWIDDAQKDILDTYAEQGNADAFNKTYEDIAKERREQLDAKQAEEDKQKQEQADKAAEKEADLKMLEGLKDSISEEAYNTFKKLVEAGQNIDRQEVIDYDDKLYDRQAAEQKALDAKAEKDQAAAKKEAEEARKAQEAEKANPTITTITSRIKDEKIREAVVRIAQHGDFTSTKNITWAESIVDQSELGNKNVVLSMLADKIREQAEDVFTKKGKYLSMAKNLVSMRNDFYRLHKMGIQTGIALEAYIQGETSADWYQRVKSATLDMSGIEGANLTEHEKREAVAAATRINSQLALILKEISGAAVTELEFDRWKKLLPGLFKSPVVNIGTVDGFIKSMRGNQLSSYELRVPEKVAKDMMTNDGWDKIETMDEMIKRRERERPIAPKVRRPASARKKDYDALPQSEKDSTLQRILNKAAQENEKRTAAQMIQEFYGVSEAEAQEMLDAYKKRVDEQNTQ